MKLSELVAYRNELGKLNAMSVLDHANQELSVIEYVVKPGDHTAEFARYNQDIHSAFVNYQRTLDDLRNRVQEQIHHDEKYWFQESYRLYSEEMIHESAEYILDRRMILNATTQDLLQSRLQNYTDWRIPGMILRPGRETWIQSLVSLDPLYIVDQNFELMEPCLANFPEAYQRRLRKCIINEQSIEPILRKIPSNQIGLCLVYNYFNFRPIEVIKRYLQELFGVLRPGGVLIMTINDCDSDKAVMLAEQYFCCYTPGQLIKDLANGLGYEMIFEHNDGGASTWIELRKPGILNSLRGGQALARVLPIL